MSNSDSFIDEVTDEVRRDKLFATMRKWAWLAVVLVLALVGGAAWTEYQKAETRAVTEGFGDALYAALEAPDAAARVAALEAITPPEGGAPVVALLIAAETEDAAAATAALQALADAPGTPPVYRDLAQLRLALRTDSGLDAQARIDLLRGLTGETQPFRNIAREALALALIETGETAEAATILTDLVADAATTPGQRQRAAQLMVALGGPTNEG